MLALSNRHGYVGASIPGIASASRAAGGGGKEGGSVFGGIGLGALLGDDD